MGAAHRFGRVAQREGIVALLRQDHCGPPTIRRWSATAQAFRDYALNATTIIGGGPRRLVRHNGAGGTVNNEIRDYMYPSNLRRPAPSVPSSMARCKREDLRSGQCTKVTPHHLRGVPLLNGSIAEVVIQEIQRADRLEMRLPPVRHGQGAIE
jgi:hypothetical protein